jgi:hypothetical protein
MVDRRGIPILDGGCAAASAADFGMTAIRRFNEVAFRRLRNRGVAAPLVEDLL